MTHTIGVIRGDGTGPEVVGEGIKVLEAVRDGFEVELVDFDLGADRYLRTGDVLPDDELDRLGVVRRDLPRGGRRSAGEARRSSSATCCSRSGSGSTSG